MLLDADARVPALLGAVDRQSVHDYVAIRGHCAKPPWAPPERRVTRAMVLRLSRGNDGTLRSELRAGNVVVARAEGLTASPALTSVSRLLWTSEGTTSPEPLAAADWRLLEDDLIALGRHLGAVLFPGHVGDELAALIIWSGSRNWRWQVL
jgi:hypothetical protein